MEPLEIFETERFGKPAFSIQPLERRRIGEDLRDWTVSKSVLSSQQLLIAFSPSKGMLIAEC